ncbi:retinaldehyde-binding protein 1-like [Stegodyphus dumicola]|uniref:retinaldehyde-binding protein 1-like n=1 Tax=Stegodyphus dumicola TaxID=202533 RepID=UPI0015AF4F25|nr:retinaldehyde-binding protein 1-like [Stegodyphus dumicola]
MMSSSSKMIEKLKQGIQGLEKVSEVKKEGTHEILPYLMHDLTPALIEEARTKLKETDEIRPKALEELRELLKNEKNLITPVDDLFLLSFLRARKFNVKKAFKLIQNYWSFRNEYSHIYDTVETQPVLDMLYRNCLGFLPYRDRQGCVVVICKIGMWDPSVDTYEVLFRAATAILIHSMQLPATQVAGYRVIFDTRGLSWKQLKMCTPSNIILLIRSTQVSRISFILV